MNNEVQWTPTLKPYQLRLVLAARNRDPQNSGLNKIQLIVMLFSAKSYYSTGLLWTSPLLYQFSTIVAAIFQMILESKLATEVPGITLGV